MGENDLAHGGDRMGDAPMTDWLGIALVVALVVAAARIMRWLGL